MASRLGTVFVELELSDKIYKQKLSEIQPNAIATAKGVETAWRALGTKAGESFDAQRRSAENAYNLIKGHATSTANDIMRAEEAKNAKITQINEQQFGKQVSWIDKIKTNWMGMAAAATAAYMLIQKVAAEPIRAYMAQEDAIMKMAVAMKNQGDYTRAGLKDMEDFSAEMQKTSTVADEMALSMMANLKSYGMTNEEVKKATKTAIDFAAAKKNEGLTITTASELIGKAYAGNTATLSRYGIVIQEGLTGSQKFTAVMDQLNQRFGSAAQGEIETYAGQWKQLQNQWGDIQEVIGLGLLKAIEGLLFTAGLLAMTFMSAGEAILETIRIITLPFTFLLNQFTELAELAGLTKTADALRSIASATDEAKHSITSAKEGVMAWTDKQYDAMIATEKVTGAVEKMGIEGQRTQRINDEATNAAKKNAEELKKLEDESIKNLIKDAEDQIALIAQVNAFDVKENKKRYDAIDEMTAESFAAWFKAIDEKEDADIKAGQDEWQRRSKLTAAQSDAYRNLYKDLKGYEDVYYEASKELIKQQANDFETKLIIPGITSAKEASRIRVAIAARTTEELAELEIKNLKNSTNFFDGVTAGFLEMQRSQKTWGEVGYDMIKTFATDAQKQLSDNLFLFVKGQWSDMKWDFQSIMDDMLRILTAKIAEMIVLWGMYQTAVLAANAISAIAPGSAADIIASNIAASLAPAGVKALIPAAAAATPAAAALAPATITATPAAASATAGTSLLAVGGAVLAPLAIYGLLGGFEGEDQEAVMRSNVAQMSTYTPQDWATYAINRDFGGPINPMTGEPYYRLPMGGVNAPADAGERWKYYYNDYFNTLKRYGINVPKIMTVEEAYDDYYIDRGYPAQRGLDYVPYDRFPIIGHEGEAVLTKPQAQEWRGGGGITHVHLHLDGREVGYAIIENEEVIEQIDYKISQLPRIYQS